MTRHYAVVLCALLACVAIACVAVANRHVATGGIDTGTRAEDSQPAWAASLAARGWDFNPDCDGEADWYPAGHPCNER